MYHPWAYESGKQFLFVAKCRVGFSMRIWKEDSKDNQNTTDNFSLQTATSLE